MIVVPNGVRSVLNSDANPSDLSLVDLTGDNDVPKDAGVEDYGYESDSDLDDESDNDLDDDPGPVANPTSLKDQSALPTSPSKVGAKTYHKDGDE